MNNNQYEFQKKKLMAYLGKNIEHLLRQNNAIIAGGSITSLFCNREINDIDVYVRDEKSLINLISNFYHNAYLMVHTKKATLFYKDNVSIQIIHIGYFDKPEEIFEKFDFTVCMGCFDFQSDNFILNENFLLHNSQRILEFNENTAFPLMSALRVQKYKDKGYQVSKTEFARILLTCMKLEINNYEELKEQLGGMYGINLDKVFDDSKPFSLTDAISQLSNLYLEEDYFVMPKQKQISPFDDTLDSIFEEIMSDQVKDLVILKDRVYQYIPYGSLKDVTDDIPGNSKMLSFDDFFEKYPLYKNVSKECEGKYFSHYDNEFKYQIGIISETENKTGIFCGFNPKLLSYHGYSTVIKVQPLSSEDIIDVSSKELRIKKVKTIEEVEDVW